MEVSTMYPAVNAMNSFTFSVWVKTRYLPATGSQKIAMQGGGSSGSVQLQVTSAGTYAFCLGDYPVNSASTTPTSNCATGGAATPGSWQMLTGIWDATNKQLRLLVGNSITPVAVNSHINGAGDRSASGPLVFGPAPHDRTIRRSHRQPRHGPRRHQSRPARPAQRLRAAVHRLSTRALLGGNALALSVLSPMIQHASSHLGISTRGPRGALLSR
ncbi:hypothetical protein JM654_19810 [Microbacterium oxydans]|nr:hypothetical protein [Microbacterium oxydans]